MNSTLTEKMSPRFSVITPVFNGISNAEEYVNCLQDQNFKDWEVIVIDDGSSDGAVEKIKQLVMGDSRFRFAKNNQPKEVAGPYMARNEGIKLALGQFICFLDIDDRWLPSKLEVQNNQLQSNQRIKLIYSTYLRVRQGEVMGKIRSMPKLVAAKEMVSVANPIPMLTACVDRKVVADLFFKPHYHEDYLFWHTVLSRLEQEQILESHEPLAIYYVHRDSLSSNKLKAISWIWRCYRELGYSTHKAMLSLAIRALLQAWLVGQEIFKPSIRMGTAKKLVLLP